MAQFMLLLHQVPGYNSDLPREKMMEMTKKYMAWAEGLRTKGKMVGGEKLSASGGRQLRTNAGKLVASDGPYAEAKDVIGGYTVVEAKDIAHAAELAKGCPILGIGGDVEIRPVMKMNM